MMMDQSDGREVRRKLRHKEVEVKSALTRTLAGLYCLLCAVFGVVFPISDALTYNESSHFSLTNAFLLYLYVVSILALIYFFTAVFRGGLQLKQRNKGENASNHGNGKDGNQGEDNHGAHTNEVLQEFTVATTANERREVVDEGRIKIAYHGEGMNLYIRIGAAVFALVSIAYKCIRIAEPFESDTTGHCIHPFSIFVDIVFIVFVVMQTFLIFKHNQVVINLQKAVVRMCLMHLLATNLSIWVSACTREIVEDLTEDSEKSENTTEPIDCREPKSTADMIAPYLFPCVIEYSLIGAAAVYRIYLDVAKPDESSDVNGNGNKVHRPPPILRHTHMDCRNGVWGLVVGIIVIILTLVGVVVFFIMEAHGEKTIATYIFLLSDTCLLLVTMVTVIVAMKGMRRLAFVAKEEDSFDDKLLVIALGGFYFYSIFIILSSARSDDDAFIGVCFLIRELLAVLQISVQTVMILDGFRRRAETDDHVVQKPGRAIVTLLLTCNFALWGVNTFEIKRAEISDIHVDYYSKLAWRLVVHVSLPLVIFYRFHSTVCLSDIWQKAYEKEKEE